jgi:hypothetical protein
MTGLGPTLLLIPASDFGLQVRKKKKSRTEEFTRAAPDDGAVRFA